MPLDNHRRLVSPRRVVIMVSVFEALSLMIAFGMLVAVIMNYKK